ncbi:MAG: rod shape-determining protein RodA [Ignavibacteria bacterium]|jgi:rod shape determining protein RodA|nr:rod shape-determining protein RodA [Ignavibacteria bacterium]
MSTYQIKQNNSNISTLAKYIDLKTFVITIILVSFGLVSIYSATSASEPEFTTFFRQLLFASIGVGVMLIVANIPTHYLKLFSIPLYVITNLLLIVVLFFGTTVYGTTGWLHIGSWSVQPAEFSKITLLLVIARHLSKKGNTVNNVYDFGILMLYFLVPFVLINIQPDFGTSLVLLVMVFGILYWGGFDGFYLLAIIEMCAMFIASLSSPYVAIIVGGISAITLLLFRKRLTVYAITLALLIGVAFAAPEFYEHLQPHQQNRINVFLNPGSDPQGVGYNVMQSLLAVGSGGVIGKGFMQGTLTQLRYIPMQWTDFIYSVSAEEFGLIGSTIVLFFLLSLVYRGISIAGKCKEDFNTVIAFGISTVFVFHIVINVGMVLGVCPVMGITLPFVSYGGTSLLTNMAFAGLLMNIHRNNNRQ